MALQAKKLILCCFEVTIIGHRKMWQIVYKQILQF